MSLRNILKFNLFISRSFCYGKNFRLNPIGLLQDVNNDDPYKTGQAFIHKLFGYRGIIQKHFLGNLYDKNVAQKISKDYITQNYYNALVDCRDIKSTPYLKCGLTFLTKGKLQGDSIYIIPDMDYISHEDIIPFTTSEHQPIENEYYNKFFIHCPDQDPTYVPTDKLTNWLSKNSESLEVTYVQREITEDIRITVMPFYLGTVKDNIDNDFTKYWRYIVRIENLGDTKSILRKRNLKIFSVSGRFETVNGKGVVGNQPILSKESPVFQYHSHVQLKCGWGHMWGSYIFERENGRLFLVKIPAFQLCSNPPNNPYINPSSFKTDDL